MKAWCLCYHMIKRPCTLRECLLLSDTSISDYKDELNRAYTVKNEVCIAHQIHSTPVV